MKLEVIVLSEEITSNINKSIEILLHEPPKLVTFEDYEGCIAASTF